MEEYQRKERFSRSILLVCSVWIAVMGGVMVHDLTRPINSNEHTILNGMVTLCAQESNTTPELISDMLKSRFYINHLQDLKARNWNDALNYLASRHTP